MQRVWMDMDVNIDNIAQDAVLRSSGGTALPGYDKPVTGYDWATKGNDLQGILDSYRTTGFQATNFGLAVDVINQMIEARNSRVLDDVTGREVQGCTIFLGYTSNLVSSGLRETFRFLAQHKLIDCIVTTAGGIEEDFIKCMGETTVGDFALSGSLLRDRGMNRIGNLLVPNDNYCKFENWIAPILDEMVGGGQIWTPSKMIARLGEKINNESSIYYWAWKNGIPVFSPALTDGSLGDMMFFHSFRNPGLVLDILGDLRDLNKLAMSAKSSGMIILGGGLVKHHICNANLMRNGAEYSVFVNTGQEFDGSDSGARPDEAVSWGKIKKESAPVKVYCDATLVFPLLVSQSFANQVFPRNNPQNQNPNENANTDQ
jgi:deoxyhypusine synthase